jgi:hypothetical protein
MGKILDYIMTGGNWEEMSRISLYKKLGKKLDNMSDEEIEEQIKLLKKLKKNGKS